MVRLVAGIHFGGLEEIGAGEGGKEGSVGGRGEFDKIHGVIIALGGNFLKKKWRK